MTNVAPQLNSKTKNELNLELEFIDWDSLRGDLWQPEEFAPIRKKIEKAVRACAG